MARPDCAIGTSEAIDRLVVVKQCPITSGRPTRMTEKSFRKLCRHHQANLVSWNYGSTRGEVKLTWCGICRGKKRPAELEIVQPESLQPPKGENEMAKKRQPQACDCCGQVKSIVSQCSGDLVCSTCASLYGSINKRPEMVLGAINKLRPELLKDLAGSEAVPVHVESSALKAIAEIVGYQGEDGDQLLEAVRTFGLPPVQELTLDLIRALDCTADDWEMAAIHTAALYDAARAQHVLDCTTIQGQAYDLGALAQGADRVREQLARIKEEYTMTVDRLRELEQQHAAHLQVFAQLADLVDGSPEYPAELPARFSALLSKAATEGLVGAGHARDFIPQPSTLDSHLLDLLLEFPAIGVERIAVIREAV